MDDEERFTDLFRAFYARVTAFARRRVSADVVQDVVAATFLAAWRHLDALPTDPLPWLYRAAALEIAAQARKERRYIGMQKRLAETHSDALQSDHADQVAAVEQWKEAFAKLSERDREALRLVAWETLQPRQAAVVLGCSPVAFKVRLHRARRCLEALIGEVESLVDSDVRVPVERSSPVPTPQATASVQAPLKNRRGASPQQEV